MPSTLFEEIVFNYIGPIDGHDVNALVHTLRNMRKLKGPRFLHVVTRKGKGYEPAEGDPCSYHGVAPFDPETGKSESKPSGVSYTQVFGDWLCDMAAADDRLMAVTPAMCEGSGMTRFREQYPQRYVDVGIAEQHALTFAAGLACDDLKPVVAIYSTFLQRAFDQVIHDVCLQNLPVVFAIDRGGIVGDDGKTHQGTFDISYLSLIPQLVVAAPKDENELQHLLYTAVKLGQPMAVRYPRSPGLGVPLDNVLHEIPVGQSEVLRHGDDVAILALGAPVAPALQAAEKLSPRGIDATVVNARFVRPLDATLISNLAGRIKKIVTIEENVLNGGFGSGVLKLLQESGQCDVAVKNIGVPDDFVEHGTQALLRSKYFLDARGIALKVLELFPEPAAVKDRARDAQ